MNLSGEKLRFGGNWLALWNTSVHLPRKTLLTIYKSFVRPHLDYGDVIYNKVNESLTNKL